MDNAINMNEAAPQMKQPTVWPNGDLVQDLNWNFYLREQGEEKEKLWISPQMEQAGIIAALRMSSMLHNMDTQVSLVCNIENNPMYPMPFFMLAKEKVDMALEKDRQGTIDRYLESIHKTMSPELIKAMYSHSGCMLDENYDKFELQVSPISPGLMIDSPIGSYILESLTKEEKEEIIPKLPYHLWVGYLVAKAFAEHNAFEKGESADQQAKAEKIIKYVMENLHSTDMDYILSVLP